MGKKGGETTSTVKLPKAIERASKDNLNIANEVGALGMSPYRLNTVAGLSPQQLAAMQGVDEQASAFGMPSALGQQGGAGMDKDAMYTALTGMPPPTTDAAGNLGYSGIPAMEAAIAATPDAQRAAIESFVMNPYTGEAPTNLSVPAPKTSFRYNPDTGRMEAYGADRRRSGSYGLGRSILTPYMKYLFGDLSATGSGGRGTGGFGSRNPYSGGGGR